MGAAIYAESREWAASSTKRKATRVSTDVGPDLGLQFDYDGRTTQDRVRVRVRAASSAVAARLSVQVDAPEHGWTSGRITVTHNTTIDLPTQTLGENQFRLTVFDGSGLPISHATSTIAKLTRQQPLFPPPKRSRSKCEPDRVLGIRICHHDLPEGMMIKEGDPVIFHWAMNDSGVLTVSVELPSLRQRFTSRRLYVDQEGHRSFDGEAS
jgi:molecular chaperone DnaK